MREKNYDSENWLFKNDSLGINNVDSFDGCLHFWRKSWPTGGKCDFKNITSDLHRIQKILQVVNEGDRFFEDFFTGRIQTQSLKGTKWVIQIFEGIIYWTIEILFAGYGFIGIVCI